VTKGKSKVVYEILLEIRSECMKNPATKDREKIDLINTLIGRPQQDTGAELLKQLRAITSSRD